MAAASAALAGLILVFIGSVSSSFDSYDTEAKRSVRDKHRRRGWFGLAGFFLALGAAVLSLVGKAIGSNCLVAVGSVSLAGSLVVVSIAAIQMVRDIR